MFRAQEATRARGFQAFLNKGEQGVLRFYIPSIRQEKGLIPKFCLIYLSRSLAYLSVYLSVCAGVLQEMMNEVHDSWNGLGLMVEEKRFEMYHNMGNLQQ